MGGTKRDGRGGDERGGDETRRDERRGEGRGGEETRREGGGGGDQCEQFESLIGALYVSSSLSTQTPT
jgi:hypothetical protein